MTITAEDAAQARARTKATARAVKAQARLTDLEAKATAAAAQRDADVYAAREAGVTYGALADALGVSVTRVTQILRRQRTLTKS